MVKMRGYFVFYQLKSVINLPCKSWICIVEIFVYYDTNIRMTRIDPLMEYTTACSGRVANIFEQSRLTSKS
jgi:hypothetical protein